MGTSSIIAGLDIYHGDESIDFPAARAAGVAYCFIKASQGTGMVDPNYTTNRAAAKSAGILAAAYHFFDPVADPVQQARHFVAAATPAAGDLIPALDIEIAGPDIGDQARACADEIKRLTGHCPIVYSSDSFFQDNLTNQFANFTLWIARYGMRPATPCSFWQNSDSSHLPGTPHALDRDVFLGTLTDLQQYILR